MSADRVRYSCRCCFIECEPYDSASKTSKVYPCRDALRLWARAHRYDPGDELGYVKERDERGSDDRD